MSRKVYLQCNATIMVPIQVELDLTLRMDEGASLERALQLLSKHKPNSKVDLEDISVSKILDVNGFDSPFDVESGVEDAFQSLPFKITEFQVVDSK